jgi:hypothetical protein
MHSAIIKATEPTTGAPSEPPTTSIGCGDRPR